MCRVHISSTFAIKWVTHLSSRSSPLLVVSFPTMTLLLLNRGSLHLERFPSYLKIYINSSQVSSISLLPQIVPVRHFLIVPRLSRFCRPSFHERKHHPLSLGWNWTVVRNGCYGYAIIVFFFTVVGRRGQPPINVYIYIYTIIENSLPSRSIVLARVSSEKSFCCRTRAKHRVKWEWNVSLRWIHFESFLKS